MFSARRLVGLGVLMVALIGCRGAPVVGKTAPVPSPAGELIQVEQVTYAHWGTQDVKGKRGQELKAGDFYFKRTFIQGKPGQALTLKIQNVGDQLHNFSLPAQGLDQDIPPKGAGVEPKHHRINADITFPQNGGLQFFCKYHTAQGMNGMLLLGDATPPSVAEPSPGASPQPAR